MASRIQGITVEIGGDTTKLQTALKGLNGEIKSTQTALKDVEKLLKLDPGNTELLAQKHKLLAEAVNDCSFGSSLGTSPYCYRKGNLGSWNDHDGCSEDCRSNKYS